MIRVTNYPYISNYSISMSNLYFLSKKFIMSVFSLVHHKISKAVLQIGRIIDNFPYNSIKTYVVTPH